MHQAQLNLPGLFNVTYLWPCQLCHTLIQVEWRIYNELQSGTREMFCNNCLDPLPPQHAIVALR